MLKSNGPRILPCGTPEMSGSLSDGVVFIRTAWYRKSSSSGTIQVLILKLRYLVICPEVFDG